MDLTLLQKIGVIILVMLFLIILLTAIGLLVNYQKNYHKDDI